MWKLFKLNFKLKSIKKINYQITVNHKISEAKLEIRVNYKTFPCVGAFFPKYNPLEMFTYGKYLPQKQKDILTYTGENITSLAEVLPMINKTSDSKI